jgi:hypothetical protein
MSIARGVGPAVNTITPGNDLVLTLNGTTAGRLIVIAVVWYVDAAQTLDSITISGESNASIIAGSKYSVAGLVTAGQLAYLANNTAGGNKTITIHLSAATYMTGAAMEYSGQNTSSQPDNSATASGSGNPTTSYTTNTDNALICAITTSNQQEPTAGANYLLWGTFTNVNFLDEVEDDVDAGAAGSKTVNFTDPAAGGEWGMAIASFKVAAVSLSAVVPTNFALFPKPLLCKPLTQGRLL